MSTSERRHSVSCSISVSRTDRPPGALPCRAAAQLLGCVVLGLALPALGLPARAEGGAELPTTRLVPATLVAAPDLSPRTTRLLAPAWDGIVNQTLPVPDHGTPRLRLVDSARNQVTDDLEWFSRHDLQVDALVVPGSSSLGDLPHSSAQLPAVPDRLLDQDLAQVRVQSDLILAFYGQPDAVVLGVYDMDCGLRRAFDFRDTLRAPDVTSGDEPYVVQAVVWAQASEGVLFVSQSHRTYAASSGGHNAYVTALDIDSGAVLWRSPPLVSNARNFVLTPTHLLTGYGFTAERDYLYILSRAQGKIEGRVAVPTGPDWLFLRADSLLVRTYDHDLRFVVE